MAPTTPRQPGAAEEPEEQPPGIRSDTPRGARNAGRPEGRVAGLLLAAGGGRRLGGRPKALLDHRGRPLVEHAVRALRDGGCHPRARGAGRRPPMPYGSGPTSSGCVLVGQPGLGRRAWAPRCGPGLASLAGTGARCGAGLAGGPAGHRRRRRWPGCAAAYAAGDSLAAAAYDGVRGHPVLFGADHWAGIAATATGRPRGARLSEGSMRTTITLVECGDVAEPYDIDTPRPTWSHLE